MRSSPEEGINSALINSSDPVQPGISSIGPASEILITQLCRMMVFRRHRVFKRNRPGIDRISIVYHVEFFIAPHQAASKHRLAVGTPSETVPAVKFSHTPVKSPLISWLNVGGQGFDACFAKIFHINIIAADVATDLLSGENLANISEEAE